MSDSAACFFIRAKQHHETGTAKRETRSKTVERTYTNTIIDRRIVYLRREPLLSMSSSQRRHTSMLVLWKHFVPSSVFLVDGSMAVA
jgi:hypothetical protein